LGFWKRPLFLPILFLQNIDFIYITGDIVDRAVWDTSVPTNIGVLTNITDRLLTVFPNTVVYPVLGNHEPSPLNV
jgi:hypothetical protein